MIRRKAQSAVLICCVCDFLILETLPVQASLFGASQPGHKRERIDDPMGYPAEKDYSADDNSGDEIIGTRDFGLSASR